MTPTREQAIAKALAIREKKKKATEWLTNQLRLKLGALSGNDEATHLPPVDLTVSDIELDSAIITVSIGQNQEDKVYIDVTPDLYGESCLEPKILGFIYNNFLKAWEKKQEKG